jgi:transcriptional regulator with XRE-family HTH domain
MSFDKIGRALAMSREGRGLSQLELAAACGIGRAQWSRYERGKELPKLPTLEKILGALAVEPEEFFRFLRSLDDSPGRPRRSRIAMRVDAPELNAAFQHMHAAIDELRSIVERSTATARRFSDLIEDAAANRASSVDADGDGAASGQAATDRRHRPRIG